MSDLQTYQDNYNNSISTRDGLIATYELTRSSMTPEERSLALDSIRNADEEALGNEKLLNMYKNYLNDLLLVKKCYLCCHKIFFEACSSASIVAGSRGSFSHLSEVEIDEIVASLSAEDQAAITAASPTFSEYTDFIDSRDKLIPSQIKSLRNLCKGKSLKETFIAYKRVRDGLDPFI